MDASLKNQSPPPLPAGSAPASKAGPSPFHTLRTPRSGNDTLAVLWHPNHLQIGVIRRQSLASFWSASSKPSSVEEFAAALDEGMRSIEFSGSDAVLLLEHPSFQHRIETLPPVSESAARNYLAHRVEREQNASDPCLWVAQPLGTARKETSVLLHVLPTSLYRAINQEFITRRLDLMRIIPVTVPVLPLVGAPAADKPVLAAVELGGSVCCTVIAPDGTVLLNRILRADWEAEPERIAMEANRCTLFIKQRHGLVVGEVRLVGRPIEVTSQEVARRCPPGTQVTTKAITPRDWLDALVRIPVRHPVNLLAGYLTHKRQIQLWRKALITAAWLGVVILGLSAWSVRQKTLDQLNHYAQLAGSEQTLRAERTRLVDRNALVDLNNEVIADIATNRGAAMPSRVLAAIAATAPAAIDVTESLIRYDSAATKWQVRITGQIRSDEFSAPEILATWIGQLERASPALSFPENLRVLTAGGPDSPTLQRFSIDGGPNEP
ncbi:MAG: hypothetical protein SFV32_05290 [Opitutaceae bacterium]|nr:hypothetical protein [Opitutaceae bacterium]